MLREVLARISTRWLEIRFSGKRIYIQDLFYKSGVKYTFMTISDIYIDTFVVSPVVGTYLVVAVIKTTITSPTIGKKI